MLIIQTSCIFTTKLRLLLSLLTLFLPKESAKSNYIFFLPHLRYYISNVQLPFISIAVKLRITMSITIYGSSQVQIFGQMVEKVTRIVLKRKCQDNLEI